MYLAYVLIDLGSNKDSQLKLLGYRAIFLRISPEAFRLNGQYNNYFCARSCSFKRRRQPKDMRLDLFISLNRKNERFQTGNFSSLPAYALTSRNWRGKKNPSACAEGKKYMLSSIYPHLAHISNLTHIILPNCLNKVFQYEVNYSPSFVKD